jgi:hypothetical protein
VTILLKTYQFRRAEGAYFCVCPGIMPLSMTMVKFRSYDPPLVWQTTEPWAERSLSEASLEL